MMARSLWGSRQGLESTSADVIANIEGAHFLSERFGIWPRFEDFEVLSLHFDRSDAMKIFETKDDL